MENLRSLTVILIAVAILATPLTTSAYHINTHSQLTEQTIAIYNRLYTDSFSQLDIKSLIKGSIDEDDNPRYVRHFYDPINKVGLLDGKFMSAKKWAQNTMAQSREGINLRDSDKLYSDSTDHSWDRAVYEYVYGSRVRAMESLGHILHLVQDATVSAHVRNDSHLSTLGVGDINLYEEYTTKIKPDISVHSWRSFKTFDELYVSVASFTNRNFLSKDTIFNNYALPKREGLKLERSVADGGSQYFGISNYGKIVRINRVKDWDTNTYSEFYFLKDAKELILANYYKILSNKAGEYGVATINTFFAAVEDEKQTERLKYMNKSKDEVEELVDIINDAKSTSIFSNTKAARQKLRAITGKELSGYKAAAELYGIKLPEIKYKIEEDKEQERIQIKGEQEKEAKTPIKQQVPPPPKPKQKIVIPKEAITPTLDYKEMQKLLSHLQKMLEGYTAQLQPNKCAGIDLSIIKYSTCLTPFEEGGYGYGAGGLGAAEDPGGAPTGPPPEGPPGCAGCVF